MNSRVLYTTFALTCSLVAAGCSVRVNGTDAGNIPSQPFAGHLTSTERGYWFQQCGTPENARYWVTFVGASVGQIEEARKAGRYTTGQRAFVRWSAAVTDERLVGPGGPALLVRNIDELRAPRTDDCPR